MGRDNLIFLEVIEHQDERGDEIAHRIPEHGSAEFKLGAKLVVRDHQAAVFFNKGVATDVFGGGTHTLKTENIPIITKLLSLPWGFTSPIRTEVYFVSLRTFKDLKWGTKEPVAFRDKDFGIVRLRAFGNYTLRVVEPQLFINTTAAGDDSFTTSEIQDFLRQVIVSRLTDLLGETLESVLDLAGQYDEVGAACKARLEEQFAKFGLAVDDFYIQAITPPPEVQKAIDERAAMGALGNLNDYVKFKTARAIETAAEQEGGMAGMGMAAGLGMGMGGMIPGMMAQPMQAPAAAAAQAPAQQLACPRCHGAIAADARFCHHCGAQMVVQSRCLDCSQELPAEAKFCLACGRAVSRKSACPSCNEELPRGAKFCFHCGGQVAGA